MSLVLRPACAACPLRLRLGKATLLRVNRLLAWALVVSPALQVALGSDFWRGLWLDLGILLAHGALSLALFGLPSGLSRWRLATGIADRALPARASFLMTAWRIALAFLYLPSLLLTPLLSFMVWAPVVVFWILLPFNLVAHVFRATDYALRRWRVRDDGTREALAVVAVAGFLWAGLVNLVR